MSEVGSQGHGGGHDGEGKADGLGAVAAVLLALAHVGVVLLKDGLKSNDENLKPELCPKLQNQSLKS